MKQIPHGIQKSILNYKLATSRRSKTEVGEIASLKSHKNGLQKIRGEKKEKKGLGLF